MEIASAHLPTAPTPIPNSNVAANRQLASAVRTLNESGGAGTGREFSFAIDPRSKQPIVRIVDSTTHELLDQVPSEYILNVAQELTKNSALKSAEGTDKGLVETIA